MSDIGDASKATRCIVKADNAWSENTYIWIFALVCLMVQFGWFTEVWLCMLVVGHTHDTDDATLFGHIQPALKSVTTTGLFDLLETLKNIWSPAVCCCLPTHTARPSLERNADTNYMNGKCTAIPPTSGSTSFHDGRSSQPLLLRCLAPPSPALLFLSCVCCVSVFSTLPHPSHPSGLA